MDFKESNQHIVSSATKFKDIEVIEEEQYLKFIKQASSGNNQTFHEQYEGLNVTITAVRGKVLDVNQEETMQDDQQKDPYIKIKIKDQLKCKKLAPADLAQAQKFLSKKQICLEKYLSSGGEADVYVGNIHQKDGSKVERVFRIVKASKKSQVLELQNEYERLTAIKNPLNLIQYEGLFEINDIFIFIMKKYRESLSYRMTYKMTKEQFWPTVFDLVDGLMELRMYNIIHSDIKPANILLDQEGRCFYSDFGMCLNLKNRDVDTDQNKGCTYKYCSPEHTNGQTLSYASDIYSFGRLILELSKMLTDNNLKKTLEEFLNENLLQKDPSKRIKPEELIPCLILKNAKYIDRISLNYYQFKIDELFELDNDQPRNKFMSLKLECSYRIAQVIMIYLVNKKQSLISYKSIHQAQFQFFADQDMAEEFLELSKIPGDILSDDIKQQYLELAILIGQSLEDQEIGIFFETHANVNLGNVLQHQLNDEKTKEAIKHYEIALNLMLKNDRTNHFLISNIYENLGASYFSLQNEQKAIQMISQALEETKLCSDKQPFIFQQFQLAQCYKSLNDEINAQKHFQQIITFWNKECSFEMKEKYIDNKRQMLIKVSFSFHEVGQYLESFDTHIQMLRLAEEIQENLEEEFMFSTDQLKMIISKFSSKDRKTALNRILEDTNNDITKKLILLEFANFYEKSEQDEHLELCFKCLNACDEIAVDMPFSKQIDLLSLFALYHSNSNNQEEQKNYLKQTVDLLCSPNGILVATTEVIQSQTILIQPLILNKMKDEAIKCYQNAQFRWETVKKNQGQIKEVHQILEERMDQLEKLFSQTNK